MDYSTEADEPVEDIVGAFLAGHPTLYLDEDFHKIVEHATELLAALPGWEEIPEDHRAKTPVRLVNSLLELTTREPFEFTTFDNPAKERSEMVVLSPIPFYTLCAHHVVPFFGTAHIGYVPEEKIAGLSKFARLVKWCAKGLWVQEELTAFLAEELYSRLDPKGTAVVMRAEHMCMSMRGVQQPGVITTTSDMRGVFALHDRLARQEFFELADLR
jgi:GTP cyclohydrolase IA